MRCWFKRFWPFLPVSIHILCFFSNILWDTYFIKSPGSQFPEIIAPWNYPHSCSILKRAILSHNSRSSLTHFAFIGVAPLDWLYQLVTADEQLQCMQSGWNFIYPIPSKHHCIRSFILSFDRMMAGIVFTFTIVYTAVLYYKTDESSLVLSSEAIRGRFDTLWRGIYNSFEVCQE